MKNPINDCSEKKKWLRFFGILYRTFFVMCAIIGKKNTKMLFFWTRWWHMNRAVCWCFVWHSTKINVWKPKDTLWMEPFSIIIATIHSRKCHVKKVLLTRDVCFLCFVNALISIAVTICEIENTQFLLMEYFLRFHSSQLGWHNEWCLRESFFRNQMKKITNFRLSKKSRTNIKVWQFFVSFIQTDTKSVRRYQEQIESWSKIKPLSWF